MAAVSRGGFRLRRRDASFASLIQVLALGDYSIKFSPVNTPRLRVPPWSHSMPRYQLMRSRKDTPGVRFVMENPSAALLRR